MNRVKATVETLMGRRKGLLDMATRVTTLTVATPMVARRREALGMAEVTIIPMVAQRTGATAAETRIVLRRGLLGTGMSEVSTRMPTTADEVAMIMLMANPRKEALDMMAEMSTLRKKGPRATEVIVVTMTTLMRVGIVRRIHMAVAGGSIIALMVS
jgi:hypothetical protein